MGKVLFACKIALLFLKAAPMFVGTFLRSTWKSINYLRSEKVLWVLILAPWVPFADGWLYCRKVWKTAKELAAEKRVDSSGTPIG